VGQLVRMALHTSNGWRLGGEPLRASVALLKGGSLGP